MSTNDDYRYVKHLFDKHVADHKCKALKLAEADKSEPCAERIRLFKQMVRVAGDLGR